MALRTEDVQLRWADVQDLLSGIMLRAMGVPLDLRLEGAPLKWLVWLHGHMADTRRYVGVLVDQLHGVGGDGGPGAVHHPQLGHKVSYLRLMAVLLGWLGEIDLATVRLATGYCWCTGRLLEYDVVQAYATGYCSLRWSRPRCYAGGSAGTLLMLAMGAHGPA